MQLSIKDEDTVEMEKLAVLPLKRHKGYGKELITFAKTKVCDLGAKRITIGVIDENTQLKDWYTSNGFVQVGSKIFPHLPFTVCFMEMVLI